MYFYRWANHAGTKNILATLQFHNIENNVSTIPFAFNSFPSSTIKSNNVKPL